jgi:hypothetical protein
MYGTMNIKFSFDISQYAVFSSSMLPVTTGPKFVYLFKHFAALPTRVGKGATEDEKYKCASS